MALGAYKKSWADEVDDEEEEERKQHAHDAHRQHVSPAPAAARTAVTAHSTPDADGENWRRRTAPHVPLPDRGPHVNRGSPPTAGSAGSSGGPHGAPGPRKLLTHATPHHYPPPPPPPPHPHRAPLSDSGAHADAAAPAGDATLPPGLHEAVTAACQDIVQPYCKAMVGLLHQLMVALPTQLPRAVAAACAAQGRGGPALSVDTAEMQKALLIGLAPIQEHVAQMQKALAHVVAVTNSTPHSLSHTAPHSLTHSAQSSAGGAYHPSPSMQQAHTPPPPPPQQHHSTGPTHDTSGRSSPSPLSFAERAQQAAAARRQTQGPSGTDSGAASPARRDAGDTHTHMADTGDDYGAGRQANRNAQKVRAGYQAYRAPGRRTVE